MSFINRIPNLYKKKRVATTIMSCPCGNNPDDSEEQKRMGMNPSGSEFNSMEERECCAQETPTLVEVSTPEIYRRKNTVDAMCHTGVLNSQLARALHVHRGPNIVHVDAVSILWGNKGDSGGGDDSNDDAIGASVNKSSWNSTGSAIEGSPQCDKSPRKRPCDQEQRYEHERKESSMLDLSRSGIIPLGDLGAVDKTPSLACVPMESARFSDLVKEHDMWQFSVNSPMRSLLLCSFSFGREDNACNCGGATDAQSELTFAEFGVFEMPCFHNQDIVQSFCSDMANTERLQSVRVMPLVAEHATQCGASSFPDNPPNIDQFSDLHDGAPKHGRWGTTTSLFMTFVAFALVLPFALQELFVLVNHFAEHGPMLCGAKNCPCSLLEMVAFAFTYGLHMYVPLAVFTPVLFFLAHDAVEKEAREATLRARMAQYVVADDENLSLSVDSSIRVVYATPTMPRALTATQIQYAQTAPRLFQWDLPSSTVIFRQNFYFWVVVLTRFGLFAVTDTQLPYLQTLPVMWWGPLRAVVLAMPLVFYSLHKAQPFFVLPYVLLDAVPLLFDLVGVCCRAESELQYMFVPFFAMLLERCFWYCSVFSMPKATPVGIKTALSTAFVTMYLMLTFVSSLFVDIRSRFFVVIVMVVQVLIFELLFSTLFVELVAFQLYAFVMNRVLGRGFRLPVLQATDSTNICTQVRWSALPLAVCGILPVFQFFQWHRPVPHSSCDGTLGRKDGVHKFAFFTNIGVCILASLITAMIRLKHGRLRAPLVLHDCLLLFFLGWYTFSLVPLALAAIL